MGVLSFNWVIRLFSSRVSYSVGSYSRFSWLNGYCDVLVLHLTARSWDETTTKERYFPLRRTVVNLIIHKDGSPWTQENIAQVQLAGCRSLPAIKSWQHSLSPVGKSKSSLTRKRFSPLSHARCATLLTTILFSLPGISVLSSFHCSRLQLLPSPPVRGYRTTTHSRVPQPAFLVLMMW